MKITIGIASALGGNFGGRLAQAGHEARHMAATYFIYASAKIHEMLFGRKVAFKFMRIVSGWSPVRSVFLLGLLSASLLFGPISRANDEVLLADYTIDEIVDLYIELSLKVEEGFNLASPGYLLKRDDEVLPTLLPLFGKSLLSEVGNFQSVINTTKRVGDTISDRLNKQVFATLSVEELVRYMAENKPGPTEERNGIVGVFIGKKNELKDFLSGDYFRIFHELPRTALQTLGRTQITGETYCVSLTLHDAEDLGVINQNHVFIENNADIEECLYEEIIQGLGLLNDFPQGAPSIFNDDGVYTRPTELDWLLLRLHMDERLKPGMLESEVRDVARVILQDFLQN